MFVITVGSSIYIGDDATFLCDGSSDEDEISNAITLISERGGGIVQLTEGTYYMDGSINLASNVILDLGRAIIEKNCNDYAIRGDGGSGSELENITIQNGTITRNAADTNAKDLIYLDYCDKVTIKNCNIIDSYYHGIYCYYCDDLRIESCNLSTGVWDGMLIDGSDIVKIVNLSSLNKGGVAIR